MNRKILGMIALALVLVTAAGTVSATEWWDPLAVERQIYTYLTEELNLNSAAACGILANIEYESNFQVTIVGDQGTSYGLCQWHNERYTALRSVCVARGLDYRTVEGQMEYLSYELRSSYTSLMGALKAVENTADGAYQAAYLWCIHFERPVDMEQKGAIRGNSAKYKYWNRYNSLSMVNMMPEEVLDPEEVINRFREEPVVIPVPESEKQTENNGESRRFVAVKPEKKQYVPYHGPEENVLRTSNGAVGFSVGMLFLIAGDGVKRELRLPEPEPAEEELPEEPKKVREYRADMTDEELLELLNDL